ncbi:hypothetical protein HN588_03675 [Candidatus Bathyarchaeota archaeon]|jgi:hypothetical protein|nr:hypothetical protein [Candidatus Bathyarchaeota archaeon]
MQAQITGPNRCSLELHMGLDDFIASGQMAMLSKVNLCSPEELLIDHLPEGLDWDDDQEVETAFAQACEMATQVAVSRVRLDEQDICFIREELIPNLQFWPTEAEVA